ncbi:TetR family transcriptional regulator [Nocardia bhagyanarayanae]|uniref:TetR family transcriptional regulator n=1 Tax=Nocardia bhagyanarayanae TaxID=1215925 RepID=A0A543FGE0_9NOCA|nr:TetR family transcriptional regulator [Nocardia bhagyanarayanae]TQM32832.1 TetR family transcriptional regulator [Nocardia bhagyanarayanae]
MGRWEPDARGRLERAALALYAERGFDQTTVEDIAVRAGLTKRTFFRHYADKRDVLFAGASVLQELVVRAVDSAPPTSSAIGAVIVGLEAAADLLRERREEAGARQAVIDANPELQERELVKLSTLAQGIAEALQGRGIAARTATLTSEAGIAVFRVAFNRWIAEAGRRDLVPLINETLDELRAAISDDL